MHTLHSFPPNGMAQSVHAHDPVQTHDRVHVRGRATAD